MPSDPLVPARRAALSMFVLGGLGTACGLCLGTAATVMFDQIMAQQAGSLPTLPPGITTHTVQMIMEGIAAIALVASVSQLVLGVFVRKASATATVIGIVLTSLFVLYFLANTVLTLFGGHGPVAAFMSLCITGAFGLQLFLLIQAARATSNVKQMQAYQAQYWQYMQQQQAYNAAGYNQGGAYNQNAYNAPPTAPAQPGASQTGWQWPAPPPPPDAPQNPPADGGPHGQAPR